MQKAAFGDRIQASPTYDSPLCNASKYVVAERPHGYKVSHSLTHLNGPPF